ncbi:MAG: hypothetical protein Kow00121_57110 [Elainellaceae cyanobacterium]
MSRFGSDEVAVPSPSEEILALSGSAPTASLTSSTSSQEASEPTISRLDPFQQAIDRASSAFTLSRSAQSKDDWRLVANRWQQAIDLMASVPSSSSHYTQSQTKVSEYRRNLTYAQQQADRPTTAFNPNGTVVIRPPDPPQPIAPRQPAASSVTSAARSPAADSTAAANGSRTFYAPIIRREGNTPVIRVMFNSNQAFDMIVDTGASGTLITQSMAQALNVVPVGAAMVDTASQRGVTVPLGYVNSIEVDGAVAQNVLVAIAGPQLGTGLLGHDFFGHYDVTIRETEVEFRER